MNKTSPKVKLFRSNSQGKDKVRLGRLIPWILFPSFPKHPKRLGFLSGKAYRWCTRIHSYIEILYVSSQLDDFYQKDHHPLSFIFCLSLYSTKLPWFCFSIRINRCFLYYYLTCCPCFVYLWLLTYSWLIHDTTTSKSTYQASSMKYVYLLGYLGYLYWLFQPISWPLYTPLSLN